MQATFSFSTRPGGFARILAVATLVLLCSRPASPDFWTLRGKEQPQLVKLSSKLPPVAMRDGSTVRFEPEIAGQSIPPETATILRTRIQTLLLTAKAGGIQLVDGAADTVIKCIITGYEPKTARQDQRQVGTQHQQIVTWIGNIEASVQVLDNRGNPLDSANLKYHLENDYVTAEKEDQVSSMSDKKVGWRKKLSDAVNVAKGGADVGDYANLAGGGQAIHDSLSGVRDKGARPPTDMEWRDTLFDGMAKKVANRIVPVDQETVAILPVDKELKDVVELAEHGRWGDVQEQAEKMQPLPGDKDAYRIYMIGLSHEAVASADASKLDEAADELNKASKNYDDAHKLKPNDREIFLAQIRVQDSLDHYLEVQHYLQSRKPVQETHNAGPERPKDKSAENAADNAALIEMVKAGLDPTVVLTFVQTTPDPNFDTSGKGLLQLAQGKVPATVIKAVQKRMAQRPGNEPANGTPPIRRSQPVAVSH